MEKTFNQLQILKNDKFKTLLKKPLFWIVGVGVSLVTMLFPLVLVGEDIQEQVIETPQSLIQVGIITDTEVINFEEERIEDPNLTKGKEEIEHEGENGEKTITYEIRTKEGTEISRKKTKEEVTKEPIKRIVRVGTYIPPTVTTKTPETTTVSETPNPNLPLKAICKDDTISYQDTPSKPDYRGMCSGHGGIKTKLGRIP